MKDSPFHRAVVEIVEMYEKKNKDYGSKADPLVNISQSKDWGVEPWVGAMMRGTDKVKRLQKYAQDGVLTNEGVEDSFLDLATYALIALVLFRETKSV